MALMAASLMWRGVAKCGSPAPKSTSFAPCARSLAASAVTAMVAETSIRPMRSAKIFEGVVVVALMLLFFQIFDGCRNLFKLHLTDAQQQKLGALFPYTLEQALFSCGMAACGLGIPRLLW